MRNGGRAAGARLALGIALLGSALTGASDAGAVTGDAVVADGSNFPGNKGGVVHVDQSTGGRTAYSSNAGPYVGTPEFDTPFGLVLRPGGDLAVSHYFRLAQGGGGPSYAGVIGVDPAGVRSTLSLTSSSSSFPVGNPLFDNPTGVTVDLNGDVLVADKGLGAIVRVNRQTGSRAIVSGPGVGPGPRFTELYDLAVAANGDILALDAAHFCATFANGTRECGGIVRVDPTTGARSVVSANQARFAGNPRFDGPQGMTINPDGDVLVANTGNDNILKVDTSTGARTVLTSNSSPGLGTFGGPRDLVVIGGGGQTTYVTDSGGPSGPQVLVTDRQGRKGQLSGPVGGGTSFATPHGIDFIPTALTGARALPSRGRASFAYTLGERATVAITLWRRASGRISANACKAPARGRRGTACVRWLRVGAFRAKSKAGDDTVAMPRKGALRSLAAGRYRATLVAANRKGVRSVPVGVEFALKG